MAMHLATLLPPSSATAARRLCSRMWVSCDDIYHITWQEMAARDAVCNQSACVDPVGDKLRLTLGAGAAVLLASALQSAVLRGT